MATNNSVQQSSSQQQQQQPPPQQQQQQQPQQAPPPAHHFQQLNTSPYHCKECGLYLNSAESLEVHLQYHKENLMKNWGTPEVKEERASPPNHIVNSYGGSYNDQQQYFGMDSNQQYTQDYPIHKAPVQSTNYRYHPYQSQHSPYDRSQHSPYDRSQTNSHTGHFIYTNDPQQAQIKTEDDAQSEILDLDSHKVQRMFMNGPEQKLFPPNDFISNNVTTSTTTTSQDNVIGNGLMQSNYGTNVVQSTNSQDIVVGNGGSINLQTNYVGNVTTTTTTTTTPPHDNNNVSNNYNQPNYVTTTTPQDNIGNGINSMPPNYHRPFEHLPSPGGNNHSVISSTQVGSNPQQQQQQQQTSSQSTKSANWKSNEARRPKTYNCTACNKWFTSSGHLKRHYNTTLHKNAVKTSGQPDPASLPISAHHHPARDSNSSRESNQSNSPPQDDTNSSPPNGEAGLSPGISRGLLSPHFMGPTSHQQQSPPTIPQSTLMMPTIENTTQFQMYPNGSAPHVTQDTATTNSLNITGEYNNNNHQVNAINLGQQQQQQQSNHPLPSFEQIQAHRYAVINYGNVNVGGGGSVTAPYTYCPDPLEITTESPRILCYKTEEEEYRLTVLTAADPAPFPDETGGGGGPYTTISEPYTDDITTLSPPSPEKAHIKRDYEETTGSPQITSTVQTKHLKAPSSSSSTTSSKPGTLKCLDCDKNFNKACYLTQHNKTFHCGAKPIKCSRCGKRFENDIIYQEHFQKHLGEKPHKCDQCPKQFNHKTDLRRHLCLHSGNKPFQCDICGKGFIRKDHMQKHCETHYRKTQNKVVGFRRAATTVVTAE